MTELNLGWFTPLHEAIPELAATFGVQLLGNVLARRIDPQLRSYDPDEPQETASLDDVWLAGENFGEGHVDAERGRRRACRRAEPTSRWFVLAARATA